MERACNQSATLMLRGSELRELAYVVSGAKEIGWLADDADLAAHRDSSDVIVVLMEGCGAILERRYAHTEGWVLKVLHDLAHGQYRAESCLEPA